MVSARKVRPKREVLDMAHGDKDSTRLKPWREIAAEIAQEQDSAKLLELVRQLLDALDKQVPEHRRSRKGPKVQR